MNDAKEANGPAHHFVKVDVPIQRKEPVHAAGAQPGDGASQRQCQHQSAVEM